MARPPTGPDHHPLFMLIGELEDGSELIGGLVRVLISAPALA
jgi:hypothetical protein